MPMRPISRTVLLPLLMIAACGSDPDPAVEPVTATNPPASPPGSPPDTTAPHTTATDTTAPGSLPTTSPVEPTDDLRYDPELLRAELDAARDRWEAQAWSSYRFTYTPTCFCPSDDVTVDVLEGRTLTPREPGHAWTVEQWLDRIGTAIGNVADIRVTYRDDGAPSSLYVDESETIADEEYGYELVDLQPVSDALDAFLVDEYGCGYGFAIAGEHQTASMIVGFVDVEDIETGPVPGTYDLAELDGSVDFGTDLMANWCDDVIEPGEPEAYVAETWDLVGGTLELTIADNRLALGTFTDLVAVDRGGARHHLGDVDVSNGMWGFLAG
jgi:hypothetical protein